MGKILCATRGGEGSYRAQDEAIALAKARDDELVFLYVVDMHFLDKTSGAGVVDVESELTKMGEFLLLMAQRRARKEGVHAQTVCYTGAVRDQIKRAAQEQQATLIVFGRPAGDASMFELPGVRTFADEIEEETGVETRVV
jgi:nucleotide-binding universal stress UspA family protein